MRLKRERVSRDYEITFLKRIMHGRILLPAVVFLIMFTLIFSIGGIFIFTKVKEKAPAIAQLSGKDINEFSSLATPFNMTLFLNYKYEIHHGDEIEIIIKGINGSIYLNGEVRNVSSGEKLPSESYKNLNVVVRELWAPNKEDVVNTIKQVTGNEKINVDVFIRSRPLFDLIIGERIRKLAGI
ncbi:MAG: hypothetical protein D6734_08795 [Candidatus Schekmanbacteria bacterium]|nr:MAG: hypothetical protein D6734_08795 [Candidatus Schekmanbacteria bacterium]